jgi:hypothetical protein
MEKGNEGIKTVSFNSSISCGFTKHKQYKDVVDFAYQNMQNIQINL